jgi:hypothetical protein
MTGRSLLVSIKRDGGITQNNWPADLGVASLLPPVPAGMPSMQAVRSPALGIAGWLFLRLSQLARSSERCM